jgi:hypothetical protein
MAESSDAEVPEGAAVFPLIPEELGVHPLLLAVLHAVVFLVGSDKDVLDGEAAEEAAQYLLTYLQRLKSSDLQRVREDINCLVAYARKENWPGPDVLFLETFLTEFGVGSRSG